MDATTIIIAVAAVAAVAIIGFICKKILDFIKSKEESVSEVDKLNIFTKYVELGKDIVSDVVRSVNQTFVNGLKDRSVDGYLTTDEAKEAFDLAFNEIKDRLSDGIQDAIEYIYGDVDKWINTSIESNVYLEKKSSGITLTPIIEEIEDSE